MKLSRKFIAATTEMCDFGAHVAAPYLRREIEIEDGTVKAEMSVCGLGFYRFWLDGEELTRGLLSPYITNPDKRLDYDVYDLSGRLTPGRHVLGFQLGNGMQNCFGGYVWDFEKVPWRSAPKMAMCLELTDKDGVLTSLEADESFLCAPSPVEADDLRQGEVYDARREIPGWNLVGFDASAWHPALKAVTPTGKSRVCIANPIKPTYELKPKILGRYTLRYAHNEHVDEGVLYDFGVNAAGLCRLKVSGAAGQEIGMVFGEYINSKGEFTVDGIRFVRPEYYDMPLYIQKDVYTCKGDGVEEWMPGFTYHGFRYVLVTGITEAQATPDLLTYVVMNTELPEHGNFSCSDETLNTLQRMTRVSTLANFYHVPTDCPHREKNGWTADAALSLEQTLLNLDPENNYEEWSTHVCAALNELGGLPGIVPTHDWGYGMGPAWDQLIVLMPYFVYRYRGNTRIVKDAVPYILRYIEFLSRNRNEKGLLTEGLGDWCAPYGPHSSNAITCSIVGMDSCEKAAFLCEAIGEKPQAAFCRAIAQELKQAIRTHLIDWKEMRAEGCRPELHGSQTSQAMCIFYNVFTEEEKPAAFNVLLEEIHRDNDKLDVGVLGARVIFHVLSAFGCSDLAHKIVTDPAHPSYAYWIARGETALCEDFYPEEKEVNSRNHHFFGDISAWFIKDIGGINFNPDADDMKRCDIVPHFVSALTHAEAFHVCPEGKIEVKWKREGEEVLLNVSAPATLHGVLRFSDGYTLDGQTEIALAGGEYRLSR